MPSSGGSIANNLRQGFRAEYLAKYIMSGFGPCGRVNPENDYGLDLIATVMELSGRRGIVSSMYGIQVKSGDAKFHYWGEQLMDWIEAHNIPILMCRVNRSEGRIKLYSTWTLHHLILNKGATLVREIEFIESFGSEQKLSLPQIKDDRAILWLGEPILDLSGTDISDETRITLAEWINFDVMNYFRRKAGLPIVFGYLTWQTNESFETSPRETYWDYCFNDVRTMDAITIIQQCATLIALNQGKDNPIVKDLAKFVQDHGVDPSPFTKEHLGIE